MAEYAAAPSYIKLHMQGSSVKERVSTLGCSHIRIVQSENDSKNVLDAFFLGKALAEALNERIESAVGEFLSSVGRLQAEQQKQVQELQEEVFERAKKAKERAAREAMEEQGVIPNSSVINASADTDVVAPSSVSSSTEDAITTETTPTDATAETDPDPTNPVVEVSIDD